MRGAEVHVRAQLALIEARPELGALLTFDGPGALAEARRVDAGALVGPLAGRTLVAKDLLTSAWGPTTAGSRHLAHHLAGWDATVIARAKAAGAVLLGKANLDEFGMGGDGQRSALQPVQHPLDPTLIPGGSSSGSAVAVAAGLADLALGSDTGGSTRQPAALCGIVGFKPTYGRLSRAGLIAFAHSLDHVGLMAPRVEGVAALYLALAGPDGRDMTALEAPVEAPRPLEDLRGVRLGRLEGWSCPLSPGVATAFERAVADLEALGAEVCSVTVPELRLGLGVYHALASAEASSDLARYDGVRFGARAARSTLEETIIASRAEGLGPEVQRRILLGTMALGAEEVDVVYDRACALRSRVRAALDAALGGVDALITPTTPEPALTLEEAAGDPRRVYQLDERTIPANLAGLPALSMPMGAVEGRPVGLQLIGSRQGEAPLLALAERYERGREA